MTSMQVNSSFKVLWAGLLTTWMTSMATGCTFFVNQNNSCTESGCGAGQQCVDDVCVDDDEPDPTPTDGGNVVRDGGDVVVTDGGDVVDGGGGLPDGGVVDPDGGVLPPTDGGGGGDLSNEDVYNRLLPTCGACHGTGTSLAYFSSLQTFENLLVYDENWIVPGEPTSSNLLPLLRGNAPGSFTQMPIGGDDFEALEAAGQTQITLAELETWIANLQPRQGGPSSGQEDATLVRLKTAEQIKRNLYAQLGLTDEDFFSIGEEYIGYIPGGRFPVYSPDATPQPHGNTGAEGRGAIERFLALGGPHHLGKKARRREVSPLFLHTLVQVSQAWCRRSLSLDSSHLLRDAVLSDTSADNAADIRANLAYLQLKMLGTPATSDDVDALFALFQTYEADSTTTAWTAVCSALVRDPLWITY